MTIKQLGGIFGRNPEFNDIDAESLNVSGTITSNGLTVDSNTLHVDPVNNFVGIRTQFPGEALTVNGNISFAGTSRVLYNLGTANTFLQTGTGDVVVLRDNGGTETARFNSAGIGFPSGKGIDFSATSGTGTSELFDDYEEGTWTPTTAGDATGVITGQAGQYTKIGRLVQCQCQFRVTTNFSSNAIDGLPFIPRIEATLSNQYGSYAVNTDGTGNVFFRINDAGTSAAFEETTGQGGTDHLPNTTNNRYMFCFTYETDS